MVALSYLDGMAVNMSIPGVWEILGCRGNSGVLRVRTGRYSFNNIRGISLFDYSTPALANTFLINLSIC